jgi:hypothetical protein
MTTMIPYDVPSWMLLESLLEWVKLLAATHIGFRFVRAYASRSHYEQTQRTLERRVRELEQLAESQGAHVQQVLDAERFAVALMLRRGSGQTRDTEPLNVEVDPTARRG